MNVRTLQAADHDAWLAMRALLWPHCKPEQHVSEMHAYFSGRGALATFVAEDADGLLCGFIEASLRPSAEGCTTAPVAYVEGIFVQPALRRRGVGRRLVAAVENWARSHGCVEFASDCQIENLASIRFHERMGFAVAKRFMHFRRALTDPLANHDVRDEQGPHPRCSRYDEPPGSATLICQQHLSFSPTYP
jgi:aminoglycoside 6'-N-acetyltransferase I